MEKKEKETVLAVLKLSRKAFLPEYLCSLLLFSLLVISTFGAVSIPPPMRYLLAGFAFFAFTSAEISRLMLRYKITPSKMIVIEGIIKQLKTNVYFHPLGFVPDINVMQGRIQRILNYGTIFVKGGTGNSFELKDIDCPHKMMKFIEELIENNKGGGGPTAIIRRRFSEGKA